MRTNNFTTARMHTLNKHILLTCLNDGHGHVKPSHPHDVVRDEKNAHCVSARLHRDHHRSLFHGEIGKCRGAGTTEDTVVNVQEVVIGFKLT